MARVSARCYCGGTASAPHHSLTKKHRDFVIGRTAKLDGNGIAHEGRRIVPRDLHGDRRDWDAEAREYARLAHEEYRDDLIALIERGPLPEPPVTEYPDSMALVTLADGAKRLGVKPVTLKKAIHRGRMVGHKYGRDWLVEESELRYYELASLGRPGRPRKSVIA